MTMNVEQQIDNTIEEYPMLKQIMEQVRECYRQHGSPEEPDGPSTGAGPVATMTNDLGCEASKEDIQKHNAIIAALYYTVGYVYVGSNNWHKQYKLDAAWDTYREAATEIIDEYIANGKMWEDFCNLQW